MTLGEMLSCAENLLKESDCLHMMCHSNELIAGTSPYTITEKMSRDFFKRLKGFFNYVLNEKVKPVTLSDYAKKYAQFPAKG